MELGRTGYYVTPGGDYSNEVGSNARLAPDVYDLAGSPESASWRQVWVKSGATNGDVSARGIKFHFGGSTPVDWTKGCFILSDSYTKTGGTVNYNFDRSRWATMMMDFHLGANDIYKYMDNKYNGRGRIGATFPLNCIQYKLILKDGF
ncbi:hypothetical protein C9994_10315 [Marivirga lumbricoides]|uniref:Uncharacterized protein n=1 Tax=Marivirga lumbricoides TaxID=1046115 RepID=A0A2T4DPK5_9BACT|nr:hypothetical protein C9994_10315 [Marivirga lumbricoides]